jgi:hypothetical protein
MSDRIRRETTDDNPEKRRGERAYFLIIMKYFNNSRSHMQ